MAYSISRNIVGTPDGKRVVIGSPGVCRFCGTSDRKKFKQDAHLIPEAFGNKWVFSADECDDCNSRFSQYEGELVNAVGSILTVGATQGKRGKVRQSGLSKGDTQIRHTRGVDGKRTIMMTSRNVEDLHQRFEQDGVLTRMRMPLPATPFKPMLAFKGLVKMALAMMEKEQLSHFKTACQSLSAQSSPVSRFAANVSLSFGSIGLAPPYVAAYLMRRQDSSLLIPSTLFLLCAGSICLQCFIPSDDEDGFGLDQFAAPTLRFKAVFPDASGGTFSIPYSDPIGLDWSSNVSIPQPIKEMVLTFNVLTTQGSFSPIWR